MGFVNKDFKDVLSKCRKVVDIIRKVGSPDKNTIVNESKLSWATVGTYLDDLIECNIVSQEGSLYNINSAIAQIVGISVGVTEIKVNIISMSFDEDQITQNIRQELVNFLKQKNMTFKNSQDYICISTPNNLFSCCDVCSLIVEGIISIFDKNYNLLSIGMSVPGIMDKNSHCMEFSPNMPWLINIDAYSLIRENLRNEITKNGSIFEIYHDMDAVTVYEMDSMYKNNPINSNSCNDVLCLFMSYGIASSLIKNNALRLFSSSEHGHILTSIFPISDEQIFQNVVDSSTKKLNVPSFIKKEKHLCACGQDCLENQIRRNVFKAENIKDFNENTKEDKLKELGDLEYSLMCTYLGFLLNHIVNTMRVDKIIVSGRILNGIEKLKYDIPTICKGSTISALSKKCIIVNGSSRLDIAAIGAAMISYYSITSKQEASNLIISW